MSHCEAGLGLSTTQTYKAITISLYFFFPLSKTGWSLSLHLLVLCSLPPLKLLAILSVLACPPCGWPPCQPTYNSASPFSSPELSSKQLVRSAACLPQCFSIKFNKIVFKQTLFSKSKITLNSYRTSSSLFTSDSSLLSRKIELFTY